MKTANQQPIDYLNVYLQLMSKILPCFNISISKFDSYIIKGGILKLSTRDGIIYIDYNKYINTGIIEQIKYTNN
jgi:hypothetical protein